MTHDSDGARHSAEELSLIGNRLKTLRKTNNLSQREVADAIGLPQSNLSRIENGKQRLNLTVLAKMIGENTTASLEFNDQSDAELTLSALQAQPHIMAAVLFDLLHEVDQALEIDAFVFVLGVVAAKQDQGPARTGGVELLAKVGGAAA